MPQIFMELWPSVRQHLSSFPESEGDGEVHGPNDGRDFDFDLERFMADFGLRSDGDFSRHLSSSPESTGDGEVRAPNDGRGLDFDLEGFMADFGLRSDGDFSLESGNIYILIDGVCTFGQVVGVCVCLSSCG